MVRFWWCFFFFFFFFFFTTIAFPYEEEEQEELHVHGSSAFASPALTRTNNACDRTLYPAPWQLRSDQLTVLINGFAQTRLSLLRHIALVYSASSLVHSVFVLWANTSTHWSALRTVDFLSSGAPIFVVKQDTSSLNGRFLPRSYVKTRAVLICDDDIAIELNALGFAFQVWKENEGRIVGFFPRSHEYQISKQSWIYTVHPDRYSVMLTKLMILATEFLYLYSCDMPEGVAEYIDEVNNCEDIAMNFLVSNKSGQGPLLVDGRPRDWGDTRNSEPELSGNSLSSRSEHMKARGDCITKFHKLWGSMPLRYSYSKATEGVQDQVQCQKSGSLVPCNQHTVDD